MFKVLIKNYSDLIPIEPGGMTFEIGIDNIFLGNYFYVLALHGVFPNSISKNIIPKAQISLLKLY